MVRNKKSIRNLIDSMYIRLVENSQSTEEIDNLYNEIMENYECAVLRELEYNLEDESRMARREFENEDNNV